MTRPRETNEDAPWVPRIGPDPIFHPIQRPGADTHQPMNEAAALRVHITHVWGDMSALTKLRADSSNPEGRRLLLKYATMELLSVLPSVDELKKLAITAPARGPGQMGHSLHRNEAREVRRLGKIYDAEKSSNEPWLRPLRNEIAAHRGFKDARSWNTIVPHHHELEERVDEIDRFLNAVRALVLYIFELDLFAWHRETPEGTHQITMFRFRPGDFPDPDQPQERDLASPEDPQGE